MINGNSELQQTIWKRPINLNETNDVKKYFDSEEDMKMKKQSVWIFVSCAVMLAIFLGAGVCCAAESASQYKSMYGTAGYKNMYNPENWTVTPSKLLLGTDAPGSRLFRYYIPPAVSGTVSLALFVPQSQMIGAVVRLGFPPQCDSYSTSTSVSESSFYGLPWDEPDATLAQLRANDMRIRNYTGIISLVTDYNASSQGEWLYVKVIFDGSTGSHVAMTNFEVGIDSSNYESWYNTASWDGNGDPLPNGQTPGAKGRCDDFNPDPGGNDPPPDPGGDDPFAPGFPPINPPPSGDYTITVYKAGSGTVNPAGPVSVQSGASQAFTFTPVSGYVVDDVIIDSMGANPQHKGAVTSYTFTNVTDDHTISAIFKVEEEEEEDYLASNLWPLYTIAMQCGSYTVEFTPTLTFTDPPADEVEYYACYVQNGKLYIAQLGLDGQISFERYITGDEVPSYGTFDFNGGDLWECTAFQNEDLMDNMLDGIVFYCGVCAVGDLDSMQGALFEFECSP